MINISNKVKLILIEAGIFCLSQVAFAQEKWPVTASELKVWGIKYVKSEVFDEVRGSDCFEDNPLLKEIMKCGGNQLQSKDGRFVVFTMIGNTFYVNDSVPSVLIPPGIQGISTDPYRFPALMHLRYARDDLKLLMNEDSSQNWRARINYYSPREVQDRFNADTVISYSARLKSGQYYKGKYNNLWVLVLQKDHSLLIRSYCLYEDMPENELAAYKAAIEDLFRYDNTDRPVIDPKELKAMHLVYQQPEGFRPMYGSGWFRDNPRLESMLPYIGHQLRSKDNSFIVFFPPGATIYTREFEDQMNMIFPGRKHDLVDKQHIFQLKGEIRNILGAKAGRRWKDHLSYRSPSEATRKFNADTAITYSVKLSPDDYYKDKYRNIWALTLQKNGFGYITMHCLYKDMSQRKLDRYKEAVESIFKYTD